jgi:hypothetical protein
MKNTTLNTRLIIILGILCLLSIILSCKSKKNSDCDAYGKVTYDKEVSPDRTK